jgi:3-methylcrotonyl-CoA carboxylase alpha subunit
LFHQDPLGAELAAAAAAAHAVLAERASQTSDPFAPRRLALARRGLAPHRLRLPGPGRGGQAALSGQWPEPAGGRRARRRARLHAAGRRADAPIDLRYRGRRQVVRVFRRGDVLHVFGDDGATQIAELDPLASAGEGAGEGGRLTAPMPGKVVASPSRPATRSARASRWR